MKYKVLTLTPPWGTLIAIGAKRIETRSWSTDYRGTLLIHQGSNLKPIGGEAGLDELCCQQPFFNALRRGGLERLADLPRGKIVAVCELRKCVRMGVDAWSSYSIPGVGDWFLTDQERAFGDYSPGRYAWLLADIRALPTPIAARGLPGLWDIELEEGELGL